MGQKFYTSAVVNYGLSLVPLDPVEFLFGYPSSTSSYPATIYNIPADQFPSESTILSQVLDYALDNLSRRLLNHSFRVYYFAITISNRFFPEKRLDNEALLIASLLHDVTTGDMAYALLDGVIGAPAEMVESVVRAISHVQDPQESRQITLLSQALQLGLLTDCFGDDLGFRLVDGQVVQSVIERFPEVRCLECDS